MIVDQAHPHHVYHLSPRHQQTQQPHHPPQQPHPETLHPSTDAVAIDMHKVETERAAGGTAFKKIEETDEAEEVEEEEEETNKQEEEEEPECAEKADQEPTEEGKETETVREDAEGEDTIDQHEYHVTSELADEAAKRKVNEDVRTEIKLSESGCSNGEKVTPPPNYNSLSTATLTPVTQPTTHVPRAKQESPNVQVP